MTSEMLKRARRLKEGREAKEQTSALNLRLKEQAYDELRERARVVSMPGYDGPDSHFAIQQDREALDQMPDFDLSSEAEAEIGRRMSRHE
jgi:hypothetical protein